MVSAVGELDCREDDSGALRRGVADRMRVHAAADASRRARPHPERSHGRRLALPAGDGNCRAQARRQGHRGAGELPRPRGRLEDHRLAQGDAAHRLPDDRAHPAPPLRMRKVAASVIVVTAFAMYAPTIHDYFMQDDFGVVSLFARRSLAYFPRWFVSPWTEDIWGYVPAEIRPFPAASYVIT